MPELSHEQFFDWLRSRQPSQSLTQDMVDGSKELLAYLTPEALITILTKINSQPPANSKTALSKEPLSRADITKAANALGVEPAKLKAVIDVECPNHGFDDEGRPVILFEPHIFYKYLTRVNIITKRDQLQALFPDIVNRTWDRSLYKVRPSYQKLQVAEVLDWDAAHMACSWGRGQVMGFNYESLGYPSLRAFVAAMHESEAAQLDAMCRYIKVNGLVDELKRGDWAGFALGYNGEGYAENRYDIKLANAYQAAKRQGW
ncbi:MAG: N-acetylmuramidase family protein [Psychrobacter sp.]|nr:N-acetylmuramidase family protein [Psychrobacter sp.]